MLPRLQLPPTTCLRAVRAFGWRHRGVTKKAMAAGRKATVALASTMSTIIDTSPEPMDHAIVQLASSAHVPVDVMHAYVKVVFAFFAVFLTL